MKFITFLGFLVVASAINLEYMSTRMDFFGPVLILCFILDFLGWALRDSAK